MEERRVTDRRDMNNHCTAHVNTQERVAKMEAILEAHNASIAKTQELQAQQFEVVGKISKCTDKLSKQLDIMQVRMDSFSERWDRRSIETDGVIAEYRAAVISINAKFDGVDKRFDEGNERMAMLEKINENFEWFRTLMNNARNKIFLGFILGILALIYMLSKVHWADVGSKLIGGK